MTVGDVPRNRKLEFLSVLLVLLFITSFFWNRTLGLSSAGWFEFAAQQINRGVVPYRDFYLFSPPLFPVLLAGFFRIAGESMPASLLFGAGVHILTALVLFGWLRSLQLSYVPSAITAVAAMVLYSSDSAETGNTYNSLCILFVVASGAALHTARSANNLWGIGAAGALASAAFFTKQTIGVFWLLFIFVGYALECFIANRMMRRGYFAFTTGFVIGTALPLGLLALFGALHPFLDQILISGPSAKGPLTSLLWRPLEVFQWRGVSAFASFIAIPMIGIALLSRSNRLIDTERETTQRVMIAVSIGVGLLAWIGFQRLPDVSNRMVNYASILAGMCCAITGATLYVVSLFIPLFKPPSEQLSGTIASGAFVLVGASMAVYLGLSISFPLYEPMGMPTLACVLCVPVLLARALRRSEAAKGIEFAVATLMTIFLLTFVSYKDFHPYAWGGWDEASIRESRIRTNIPKLRGMVLSPATSDIVGKTLDVIRAESRTANDVFTYPHLPIFYFLADKQPATFAFAHFADVVTDKVLDEDIDRLRRQLPRVLIMMPYSEGTTTVLESLFRTVRPSAIRRMNDFLVSMKPDYDERARWPMPDGSFVVWVLKDQR